MPPPHCQLQRWGLGGGDCRLMRGKKYKKKQKKSHQDDDESVCGICSSALPWQHFLSLPPSLLLPFYMRLTCLTWLMFVQLKCVKAGWRYNGVISNPHRGDLRSYSNKGKEKWSESQEEIKTKLKYWWLPPTSHSLLFTLQLPEVAFSPTLSSLSWKMLHQGSFVFVFRFSSLFEVITQLKDDILWLMETSCH